MGDWVIGWFTCTGGLNFYRSPTNWWCVQYQIWLSALSTVKSRLAKCVPRRLAKCVPRLLARRQIAVSPMRWVAKKDYERADCSCFLSICAFLVKITEHGENHQSERIVSMWCKSCVCTRAQGDFYKLDIERNHPDEQLVSPPPPLLTQEIDSGTTLCNLQDAKPDRGRTSVGETCIVGPGSTESQFLASLRAQNFLGEKQ